MSEPVSREIPSIGRTVMLFVKAETVVPLRHRILRPGLPIETARFTGDDDPANHHVATFISNEMGETIGEPICCASFMRTPFDGRPAWQLRGMATETEFQGKGLGGDLLRFFENSVESDDFGMDLFWCNARMSAVTFYERNGWCRVGEVFDIKGVGPHCKMTKRVCCTF